MSLATLPRRAVRRILGRRIVPVDALRQRPIDRRVYCGNVQCKSCGSWNTTGDSSSWMCHNCGAMEQSG